MEEEEEEGKGVPVAEAEETPSGSRLMTGNLVSSHRLPGTTSRRVADARRTLRGAIGVFNLLRWDAGELGPRCLRGWNGDGCVRVCMCV